MQGADGAAIDARQACNVGNSKLVSNHQRGKVAKNHLPDSFLMVGVMRRIAVRVLAANPTFWVKGLPSRWLVSAAPQQRSKVTAEPWGLK